MKKNRLQVIVLVVLLGLVITGLAKGQAIQDWWRLRGYVAPSAVAQLATDDTMNSYTRHLFYLNKPQLPETVTAFRASCPENEDTIVLGCYHTGQNGIFIYAVQDPTLAGVQQVTAAHEVLHSVYARLSSSERKKLDAELMDFDQHGLTDTRVKAEVALYQKTEPTAVYDEMSCTFGTEIATLPAALEQYYQQFFSNRQKIVGYEQQYQTQFTSRQQQVAADDAQLQTMKQSITVQQTALTAQDTQITTSKANLNALLANNQTAAYNAAVPAYNEAVDSYNAGLVQLQQAISAYNQLVAIRNAVAGQLTSLAASLDTRLTAK